MKLQNSIFKIQMMRKFGIILLFMVSVHGWGQKNTLYIELLGNGGIGSLNYELQLTKEPKFSIRTGIGYSLFEFGHNDQPCSILCVPDDFISVPLSVHYFFPIKNHSYWELGLGYTIQIQDETNSQIYTSNFVNASFGYRKHFGTDQKWIWKINLLPIIGKTPAPESKLKFVPWLGVSLGKRF